MYGLTLAFALALTSQTLILGKPSGMGRSRGQALFSGSPQALRLLS